MTDAGIRVALIAVVAALAPIGCATIVSGTTQTVSVNSNITGAQVLLNGRVLGTTPFTGQIARASDSVILVKKDGYTSQSMSLATSIEPIFWGNILIGGTTGSSTDAATGALWRYSPATFFANLEPASSGLFDRESLERESKIRFFVLHNYRSLTADLAAGSGEYLSALRHLLGADSVAQTHLLRRLRGVGATDLDAPSLARRAVALADDGSGQL